MEAIEAGSNVRADLMIKRQGMGKEQVKGLMKPEGQRVKLFLQMTRINIHVARTASREGYLVGSRMHRDPTPLGVTSHGIDFGKDPGWKV